MVMFTMNEGWEDRFSEILEIDKNPDTKMFSVEIRIISNKLVSRLSLDEYSRMVRKLEMVSKFANVLAINMLKGTIKYPHDDRTPEEWQVAQDDEIADAVNYRVLRDDAISKKSNDAASS